MSVSNRFRDIHREVADFLAKLDSQGETVPQGEKAVGKACGELAEWAQQVGDIPRMKLEFKLTPILLKAHNHLDRARLLFEEKGFEEQANLAWDLQQKIYRLLNDL
jgi:hypothetical protein